MGRAAEHQTALGIAREEANAVRRYLEALEASRVPGKRGPKRTVETVKRRLVAVDEKLPSAKGVIRLQLVQERTDLLEELESLSRTPAVDELADSRAAFVRSAASYAARKGISHAAWREIGVDSATLREAGIHA
ncbi:MAG: hypothetical protein JWN67_1407 [Actinomycetia bacterium]|nr:hypothetical protein [Actinomycetes bacterium]